MARSWVSRATTAAALLLLLPFAAAVSEQAGKASPPGMLELTDTTFIKSLKGEEQPQVSVSAPSLLPPVSQLVCPERSPARVLMNTSVFLLQNFRMIDGFWWSFTLTGDDQLLPSAPAALLMPPVLCRDMPGPVPLPSHYSLPVLHGVGPSAEGEQSTAAVSAMPFLIISCPCTGNRPHQAFPAPNPAQPLARCPHCQHFKPEYEKVAAFFYERGEQEPVVQVARLDCAEFVSVPARDRLALLVLHMDP